MLTNFYLVQSFAAPGQSIFDTMVPANSAAAAVAPAAALGFNVGTFTVPQPPPSASSAEQTPTSAGAPAGSAVEKKAKLGKKAKVTPLPAQQMHPDSSGKFI